MRAVIYCRVSTKEQVENFSLGTQEEECRRFCERNGIEIDRIFREQGESAKTIDRTEFQKLLAYCEQGKGRITHVVVYNVSRFSRDKFFHLTVRFALKKLGITLRSVTEPIDDSPEGVLLEGIFSDLAQYDNSAKARRTVAGMKTALAKGRWTHQPPLGYLKPRTKTGASLVPDPDRADLIRSAFADAGTGRFTKKEIADRLNAQGFTTRAGRRLSPQTLNKILENPIYAGFVVVPKWEIKERGDFQPLVSEDVFNRVNPSNQVGAQVALAQPGQSRVPAATIHHLRRLREIDDGQ